MTATATVDPVTGLPGRDALNAGLATAAGAGPRSVFLFDVDYFKTVNDVYGHLRGDAVLRDIATRAAAEVADAGTVYRYGGDEFVVVLPGMGATDALRLALRLTTAIRETPFAGEPPLHLSVSLGVATSPADGDTAEGLLACADRRNYLAKHRGRGGAVADNAETTPDGGGSRLWERDAALAAVHDFLTRLSAHGRGALRVTGPPGAGHTRFLAEIRRLAALRGLTDSLVLADVGDDPAAAVLARPAGVPLGVAYAVTGPARETGLAELGSVRLDPWSPATVHIWLRSQLQGEPAPPLVDRVVRESAGLPAAAARVLDRLRARDEVAVDGAGGWALAGSAARPGRRVKLPAVLSTMVSREPERRRVAALLAEARLVTLTGPGGIGKTQLSLAVAREHAEAYAEGVVFVPLADATRTDEAVRALATALEVDDVPGEELTDSLAAHLADAELLLVTDNLEQVPGLAPVLTGLLAGAPGVRVLATSREPLDVYGEHVYRVPPLPLPGDGLPAAESPAVVLFAHRARAADADFALTAATLPAVAALCRRLDGLPLAIELAAARIDRHTPAELLDRLDRHLDVPGTGPRDRPERQQTMRGAIDWSYALLDAADRRIFADLAVFAGGWTTPAAAAVVPGSADRLARLAERSLLTTDGGRFRMLQTIRAYALEKLTADVRARHAGYFAGLAADAADGMTGSDQAAWADRLDDEYANFRDAFAWAVEHGDPGTAARICLGLWRYWRNGNHLTDGRRWLDRLLDAPAGLDDADQAALLYPAAVLAATQDDDARATLLGERCLRLAERIGDRHTVAQARNILGVAASRAGRFAEAEDHFRFGLRVWQDLGRPGGTAVALGNLAKLALRQGRTGEAAERIDECLTLERAAGNSRGVLLGLECLTDIRLAEGDLAGARASAAEGLALSRDLGDAFGEAMAVHQLGLAARAGGEPGEAMRLFREALTRRHEVGDREDLAISLDCVADLLAGPDPQRAVRLLAGAHALRRAHHLVVPPDVEARRDAVCADLRSVLGARPFADAWREGLRLSVDDAVTTALGAA